MIDHGQLQFDINRHFDRRPMSPVFIDSRPDSGSEWIWRKKLFGGQKSGSVSK